MTKNFEIEIASIPTQENLVSEIFYDGVQWVQIFQHNGELLIQFYSYPNQEYWEFPFDLAIQVLEKAKNRLIEVSKKSAP
jgi:hypothetical protein